MSVGPSARVTSRRRWKTLRWLALKRDGHVCQECGARGRLEVHHREPVRLRPDLAYNLENLVCLCPRCHSRITRIEVGLGVGDLKREQWRQIVSELQKPSNRKELSCSNP